MAALDAASIIPPAQLFVCCPACRDERSMQAMHLGAVVAPNCERCAAATEIVAAAPVHSGYSCWM